MTAVDKVALADDPAGRDHVNMSGKNDEDANYNLKLLVATPTTMSADRSLVWKFEGQV